MFEHEIRIRIAGEAFIYSLWRSGELIETVEIALEPEVVPGYYGGSEVMD